MVKKNKTVKVKIIAKVRADCNYTVDMKEEDYKKYEEVVTSQMTSSEMDDEILDIASKYRIYGNIDLNEPEDIEFHRIEA
ncbi:MAG: hypothetical protein ACL7AX_13475 [Candidatus Arsenophonus phytopathogenicus]